MTSHFSLQVRSFLKVICPSYSKCHLSIMAPYPKTYHSPFLLRNYKPPWVWFLRWKTWQLREIWTVTVYWYWDASQPSDAIVTSRIFYYISLCHYFYLDGSQVRKTVRSTRILQNAERPRSQFVTRVAMTCNALPFWALHCPTSI